MTRLLNLTLVVSFFFPAFLTTAIAADVSGTWKGEMSQGGKLTLVLKANSEALTGTWFGASGQERPIKNGKLTGDAISFSVDVEWQGAPVTLLVKGTVSGNEMRLRIDADNGYWGTDAVVKKQ